MKQKEYTITLIEEGVKQELKNYTVVQPRLTALFTIELAQAMDQENSGIPINQTLALVFASHLKTTNGDRLFEYGDDVLEYLHYTSMKVLIEMLAGNEDLQEMQKIQGQNQTEVDEKKH